MGLNCIAGDFVICGMQCWWDAVLCEAIICSQWRKKKNNEMARIFLRLGTILAAFEKCIATLKGLGEEFVQLVSAQSLCCLLKFWTSGDRYILTQGRPHRALPHFCQECRLKCLISG